MSHSTYSEPAAARCVELLRQGLNVTAAAREAGISRPWAARLAAAHLSTTQRKQAKLRRIDWRSPRAVKVHTPNKHFPACRAVTVVLPKDWPADESVEVVWVRHSATDVEGIIRRPGRDQ